MEIKPTNHCEICRMVIPGCLCNTCKKDNPEEACCKKHNVKGCEVQNCTDYENERPPAKETVPVAVSASTVPVAAAKEPGYDF